MTVALAIAGLLALGLTVGLVLDMIVAVLRWAASQDEGRP